MGDVALEDVICASCKGNIEVMMNELFIGEPVTCPACGHQQSLSAMMPSPVRRSRTSPPGAPQRFAGA